MLVNEIMTRGVQCGHPDITIQQAAKMMSDLDVGLLPICGDSDRLEGMVSDRDIAIRAVAEARDARTTRVSDIMTRQVVYCFEDDDVSEAVNIMSARQIRRLVVLDRNRRLAGILSLADVAVKTQDQELAGVAVEAVSEPIHA
jgi:CBS domain-containing protein